MKRFFLLFISFSLFACGGYQTVPITLPDGFIIHARIADTPQKQAQGLMFVKNLPENEGMLFVFDEETEQLFWMKNTLIDLDMVFIGANKQVNSFPFLPRVSRLFWKQFPARTGRIRARRRFGHPACRYKNGELPLLRY